MGFSLFLSLFFLFCFSSLPIFHSCLPVEETGAGYRERSGKGKKEKKTERKKERKKGKEKEQEKGTEEKIAKRRQEKKKKKKRKKLIDVNSLASLLFPLFSFS